MITDIAGLKTLINNVVEYNWSTELRDFKENPDPGHIFVTLVQLDNFNNGSEFTPHHYVKGDS